MHSRFFHPARVAVCVLAQSDDAAVHIERGNAAYRQGASSARRGRFNEALGLDPKNCAGFCDRRGLDAQGD